jgi:hypothetical protein
MPYPSRMIKHVPKKGEGKRPILSSCSFECIESNALIAVSVSLKDYVAYLAMALLSVVSEALNIASFDSFPQCNNALKNYLSFEIYAGQRAC